MSYTKNTWQTGDTVTAEKLNHMEDGIAAASGSSGGGVLTVHEEYDGEDRALDKTWQEVYDAGFSVLELSVGVRSYGILAQIAESGGDYVVVFVTLGQTLRPRIYVANSANGYPVYTENT